MLVTQKTNTIFSLLRWAIDTLKDSGIESPDTDAETLLSHVLSCDRIKLHTNPDKDIDNEYVNKYKSLISKRARRVPLQYITGHVEFMSLDFTVDNRVLIPRQETELLVDAVLDRASNKLFSNKTINIMDIGTGSCSIAVSLSVHLKNAQIYASDISEDALGIARMNAQKHNVANRIHLLHGNLFGPFNKCINKGCVDFIVSNPPYIKESEWIGLEPEVREYEPYIALVAGEDGLTFYKQIVNEAHMWLKSKGFLVVEVGDTQARRVKRLVEREGHFENIEVLKDLQKIERIVIARRM